MRRINKFKYFSTPGFPLRKFPNKLLTFYRPKWNSLKLKIKDLNQVKKKFVDSSITKVSFRFIERSKRSHKSKLVVKKHLKSLFDNISLKSSSTLCVQKKDLILKSLISPLYRLDVLLWYLNIFSSVYQIRQYIGAGCFRINNKRVQPNYILRKGDVISTHLNSNVKHDIEFFNSIYLENILFLTFLEIDSYTKTVTIVKSQDEISTGDHKLLVDQYINIYKNF